MNENIVDARQEATAWRNRFVRLLDRTPVPTAVSESDGTILVVNPAFATLWGIQPSQLRGHDLQELFTPTDKKPLFKLYEAIKHRRRSRYPIQVHWTVQHVTYSGRLTIEPVGDELIDPPPLLASLHVAAPEVSPACELQPREAHILELVAAGSTTAVIARAIGITVDGVNYHLAQLCRRLNAPNRTALVARAYALSLLDPTTWPPVRTRS